jgi:hypothetical protein
MLLCCCAAVPLFCCLLLHSCAMWKEGALLRSDCAEILQ